MEQAIKLDPETNSNGIRVVLAERCLTNRWLADKMGVTDMTVSHWVTNKVQPSMKQFVQMSKILDVKLEDLIEPALFGNVQSGIYLQDMHKCSKDAFVMVINCPEGRKIYGATVDRISQGQYSLIWAFKLNPQQAKNEGFGESKVSGQLTLDPEYPGCPYCGSKQLVFCGCGAVICYNGERVVTCPKCGCSSEVSSANSVDMHGGAL